MARRLRSGIFSKDTLASALGEAYVLAEKARSDEDFYKNLIRRSKQKTKGKQNPAILVVSEKFHKSQATLSMYATILQLAHDGPNGLGRPMTRDELVGELTSTGYRNFYDNYKNSCHNERIAPDLNVMTSAIKELIVKADQIETQIISYRKAIAIAKINILVDIYTQIKPIWNNQDALEKVLQNLNQEANLKNCERPPFAFIKAVFNKHSKSRWTFFTDILCSAYLSNDGPMTPESLREVLLAPGGLDKFHSLKQPRDNVKSLGRIKLNGLKFRSGSGEIIIRAKWKDGNGEIMEIISFTTD